MLPSQIEPVRAVANIGYLAQQLCRWLLLSLDRLSSNQLTMTEGTRCQHARGASCGPHRSV
jgi:hypothetical protein